MEPPAPVPVFYFGHRPVAGYAKNPTTGAG
jgi:hypothetical protein